MTLPPLDFARWLEENGEKLQPPVNNRLVQAGKDFVVMAVGGPNRRTDYHINETEEWFFQLKGDMLLRVVEGTKDEPIFKDVIIKEGEMYLHPGGVPHNPIRYANTLGLVIEHTRRSDNVDCLCWYCEHCHQIVYEEFFHCADIQTQLKDIILKFAGDDELRTCKRCGWLNSTELKN